MSSDGYGAVRRHATAVLAVQLPLRLVGTVGFSGEHAWGHCWGMWGRETVIPVGYDFCESSRECRTPLLSVFEAVSLLLVWRAIDHVLFGREDNSTVPSLVAANRSQQRLKFVNQSFKVATDRVNQSDVRER